MKSLSLFVVAISGLACAQAQFSPVSSASKNDASSCPETTNLCTGPGEIPSGAPCDPVCQVGNCNCSDKCSIAGDGTVACLSKGTLKAERVCTRFSPDSPQQHDDCEPGSVCLPILGLRNNYCFKLCNSSLDCPGVGGVRCAERALTRTNATAMVCDPTYYTCDPAAPGGGCCDPTTGGGCTDDSRVCYLVSEDPISQNSRTVCEYTSGSQTSGSCTLASDCYDGYSCDPTDGTCRQVCDTNHACVATGTVCTLNGNQYGFCR